MRLALLTAAENLLPREHVLSVSRYYPNFKTDYVAIPSVEMDWLLEHMSYLRVDVDQQEGTGFATTAEDLSERWLNAEPAVAERLRAAWIPLEQFAREVAEKGGA